MSRGVLYLASGPKYIDQAKKSAASVKRYHPDLSITLYTDKDTAADVFDQVVLIDEPVEEMADSRLSTDYFPYDQNLYLDADTLVCADISELFNILDQADLALAHNVGRTNWDKSAYIKNGVHIPETFTEYNTGVVAYNDCSEVHRLFSDWNRIFTDYDWSIYQGTVEPSQPAFRVALYNSDVRFVTIPKEYNFMLHAAGHVTGYIRILHQGPSDLDLSEAESIVNKTTQARVVRCDAIPSKVLPHNYTIEDVIFNIEQILRELGYK